MSKFPFLSAAAVCLLLVAAPLQAQQDPCVVFFQERVAVEEFLDADGVFALLYGAVNPEGCILGETDTTGIEAFYRPLYAEPDISPVDRSVLRQALFDAVSRDLRAAVSGSCGPDNFGTCMLQQQLAGLTQLEAVLNSSASVYTDPLLNTSRWLVDQDGDSGAFDGNLHSFLAADCAGGLETARCGTAVSVGAKLIRANIAATQVIVANNKPIIDQNAAFISLRDREWAYYFNEVSVQYPWELAVNSWRFQRSTTPEERAEFPRAPDSKWIVMHPSVGFEYIDTPDSGESLEAAIILELGGYEWWTWKDGKASNRWGLSAAISYADISGMDDVGYGVLLHTPVKGASIGAVWRDGDDGSEVGITMNINVIQLFVAYHQGDLLKFLGQ